MENLDLTLPVGEGYLNVRVGAIIKKNDKFLMVGNDNIDYLYSVGGRVSFGETAEQAVVREVFEETGAHLEIDRLGFIHENYFISDIGYTTGKEIYEIAFYFYMKVPEEFDPVCESYALDDSKEHLFWVTADMGGKMFPEFFRTELDHPSQQVKHIVVDDRPQQGSRKE